MSLEALSHPAGTCHWARSLFGSAQRAAALHTMAGFAVQVHVDPASFCQLLQFGSCQRNQGFMQCPDPLLSATCFAHIYQASSIPEGKAPGCEAAR